MFGKFDKKKNYVFSKDEYIKDRGIETYRDNKIWVDVYNGTLIEKREMFNRIGYINGKMVFKCWCKEVI